MAVYTLKAIVQHEGRPPREIVTNIAGCTDPADAERKLRLLYPVRKIKAITEVKFK